MKRDYNCKKKLRSPQQGMLDSVFDNFNEGHNRLLIIAPTGLGKTAVMGGIAKHYLKVKPRSVVLILSHLSLLIEQSGQSFKDFWDLDSEILQADIMPSINARCILSTVQSSSMTEKIYHLKEILPSDITIELILLDEAHINSGVERVEKILNVMFPNAKVVGFTGSPFKQNKSMVTLFNKVAYSVSLKEAIEMGILVKPEMHSIIVDKKDFADVLNKCLLIIKTSHANDKCILFLKTIEDSENAAKLLSEHGIKSASITSNTPDSEREKYLIAFRNNTKESHQVLVSVDVLSVGFDAPALKSILMPYGTGSVSLYLQRIGRGLRPYQDKTHCDIYIGSNDPKVEAGEWKLLHEKAINTGSLTDDEECEEYKKREEINLATVQTIRKLRDSNMNELANMIEQRIFPKDFLEHLVTNNIVTKYHHLSEPSNAQHMLLNKRKIESSNLGMNEAATIINTISSIEGWSVKRDIVPSGKFAGKTIDAVPFSYINLVSKHDSKYYNSELAEFFGKNKQNSRKKHK